MKWVRLNQIVELILELKAFIVFPTFPVFHLPKFPVPNLKVFSMRRSDDSIVIKIIFNPKTFVSLCSIQVITIPGCDRIIFMWDHLFLCPYLYYSLKI